MKIVATLSLMLASSLLYPLLRMTACEDPWPDPSPTPEASPSPSPSPAPTPTPGPSDHGAACSSSAECAANESCQGIPNVEEATGCCTPKGSIPGQGELCSSEGTCGEGLECIGDYCSPAWMVGEFSRAPDLVIPDGDTAGVVDAMLIRCLATVAVDVTLDLRIEHPRIGDLVVTMADVSGDIITVLHDRTGGDADVLELTGVTINQSGDEYVNGYWPLTVKDTVTGETGKLVSWTLHVTSRWD